MFYKINRNWGLLFLSAGKINHSEYIVSHGYNVAGNGERDTHSERISVMVRKYAVGHMGNLSGMSWERLNQRSAAETLSLIIQIWKCSESINDFESKGL